MKLEAIFEFQIAGVPTLLDLCAIFISSNKEKYYSDVEFENEFPEDVLIKLNSMSSKRKNIEFI